MPVVGPRATAPLAFHLWLARDTLGLGLELGAARSLAADTEATDRLGVRAAVVGSAPFVTCHAAPLILFSALTEAVAEGVTWLQRPRHRGAGRDAGGALTPSGGLGTVAWPDRGER